jgi:hydrogenase maturation protease
MGSTDEVLVIGYGNPGRLDDGLGPALAEHIGRTPRACVRVDADYQLTIEDAAAVAECGAVIFADAAVEGPEPFDFRRIEPVAQQSFTSHSVAPQAVLGLAHGLFHADTVGYVLALRGYEFNEFQERLSPRAGENLRAATRFLESLLDLPPESRLDALRDAAEKTVSEHEGTHKEQS